MRSVGSTIVPFEGMGGGLLSLNETVRDLRSMASNFAKWQGFPVTTFSIPTFTAVMHNL